MKWDTSSITQLIAAAAAIFIQIWTAVQGHPVDLTHTAVGVGLAASSVGHAIHNNVVSGGK